MPSPIAAGAAVLGALSLLYPALVYGLKSLLPPQALVGLALLLVIVGTLSWGGLQGLYAYRALVRNLHGRVETELPLLNELLPTSTCAGLV